MTTTTSLITGEVNERIKEAGIDPKKSLGQNFLVNGGIYQKIITAIDIKPSDTIIEVGPGLGTLTDHLIKTGAKIVAIEKDDKLAEYLKNKYKDNDKIEIIHGDILEFSARDGNIKLENGNFKLVGNIPYYLTSHLMKIIFDSPVDVWPIPEVIVFLVQKEVAQRIVAKPPEMNLLAVSVQYYSTPKIISYVSRGSFYPRPKVDSAIIQMKPNGQKPTSEEMGNFFRIVKAGFSASRKQLANNLSSALKLPRNEVDAKLESADISPKRRAETLTLQEWQKITKIFF